MELDRKSTSFDRWDVRESITGPSRDRWKDPGPKPLERCKGRAACYIRQAEPGPKMEIPT